MIRSSFRSPTLGLKPYSQEGIDICVDNAYVIPY